MRVFRPDADGWQAAVPRLGVDLVSVARIERAIGHGLINRICGEAEITSGPGDDAADGDADRAVDSVWAASTWAVKEAAIKIAGGRPPGFDWRAVRVRPERLLMPLDRWLGACLLDTVGGSTADVCGYEWVPQPGAAACQEQQGAQGRASGHAAWCRNGPVVAAIAISCPAPDDGDCPPLSTA